MNKYKIIIKPIGLVFAATLCAAVFLFSGGELPMFSANEPVQKLIGATYETTSGAEELALPATLKNLPPRTPVTLYAQIPPGQDSLYIKSVFAKAKLYLNDTLVYEFGRGGSYPAFMDDPPTSIAIIPLPENAESVSLRLEYLSPSQRNELSLPAMYTGSEGALIAMLFRANGFSLLFSFVLIFIGAAMGIIFLVFIRKTTGGMSFLWLGLFSLSAGIWILGECDLSAFLIPYPSLLYALDYLGLFGLTIPFLRFGLLILKPKNKLPIYAMLTVQYIAVAVALLLQFTGTVDLMKTLYVFHIIAPLGFIVFAADLLWEYFHHGNRAAIRFAPAVTILAASVVLELCNYWIKLIGTFTVMFQLGAFCFILLLGVECGRFVREAMSTAAEKDALVKLNRIKTDFLHDMNHELRTPLAIISTGIAYADGEMEPDGDPEKARAALRDAINETMRIGRMLDGMADMADMNEIVDNRQRVDFAALLCESAEAFRLRLEAQGVNLRIELPEKMPDVYVEADKFTRVMDNLLGNAMAHTPEGEITVSASYDAAIITVCVSDTGKGIPPDLLPRVFERGVSGRGGTGYGLAICKLIVEAHGGAIEAASVLDTGTVITFTVPVYGGQEAGHSS